MSNSWFSVNFMQNIVHVERELLFLYFCRLRCLLLFWHLILKKLYPGSHVLQFSYIMSVWDKTKIPHNDAWAHMPTTSHTSSTLAIQCNDTCINILILNPELVGLEWYILALHKNSQNAFFFFMCMVGIVTFYVLLSIARGETQLITSTGQFMQPFLI